MTSKGALLLALAALAVAACIAAVGPAWADDPPVDPGGDPGECVPGGEPPCAEDEPPPPPPEEPPPPPPPPPPPEGPTLELPAPGPVEANGPDGAVVVYPAPLAVDAVDGPVPATCAPASGTLFPLGATTVECSAVDSEGAETTGSFVVSVVDTTPPVVTPPADIEVVSAAPVAVDDPRVTGFLAGANASDTVDPAPALGHDAPASFPPGTATVVTFTAEDASGNSSSAAASVTIVVPPPAPPPPATPGSGPSPPPPSPPVTSALVDRTPPPDVVDATARAGDHKVRLRWTLPPDAVLVEVHRSAPEAGSVAGIVYRGREPRYVDRRLRNGRAYRYVIVAFDAAGNRSAGVGLVAEPSARLLASPGRDARVKSRRPRFRWAPVKRATYYNLQLYRIGGGANAEPVKVLSVWPKRAHYRLRRTWRYDGKSYTLKSGRYRWYVWPGFGPPVPARYGPLRGQSEFMVVR